MDFDSLVRFGVSGVEMLENSSQAFIKSHVRTTAFILSHHWLIQIQEHFVMHLPKILMLLKQKGPQIENRLSISMGSSSVRNPCICISGLCITNQIFRLKKKKLLGLKKEESPSHHLYQAGKTVPHMG